MTFRRRLMRWWAGHRRSFFWRTPRVDPFHVLVVEVLVAKTRAELVHEVASGLLDRYATPRTMAAARTRDVERRLYPLGLHRKRARSLIACAKAIDVDRAGVVPSRVEELARLPAVGRYAANAVACVAFGEHVPVVDANVSRVYQRVFSHPAPPERLAAADDLWRFAAELLPRGKARDFNWAVLDFGGTVCTAKAPACTRCPVSGICENYHGDTVEERAARGPKSSKRNT